jgi:hypothetical protein
MVDRVLCERVVRTGAGLMCGVVPPLSHVPLCCAQDFKMVHLSDYKLMC